MDPFPEQNPHAWKIRNAVLFRAFQAADAAPRLLQSLPIHHDTTVMLQTTPTPLIPWHHRMVATAALAFVTTGMTGLEARAAEIYGQVGFPGYIIGLGTPVGQGLTLRADIGGLDKIERNVSRSGIDWKAEGKLTRIGLFGDWYPTGGRFRLTAGLTINDMKADLSATGEGRSVNIGGTTYTLGADDRVDARIEMPATSPYIGIGWGHHAQGTGFGFIADVGVGFGRPKVTTRVSGPLATQPTIQADLDRELAELRDTVRSIRVVPQVTLGVNYRFR
jgi:hypothetical protein